MEEAAMLGSFIRLVDYMLVEALVDRTVGTVEELVAMLEAPRASTDKTHKVWYTLVQGKGQIASGIFTACTFCPTSHHNNSVSVTGASPQWMHVVWLSSNLLHFCRECS